MHSANNPLFAEGYLLNDNLPRWASRSFLFAGSRNDGVSGGGISFGQPGSGPGTGGRKDEEEAFPGCSASGRPPFGRAGSCRRFFAAFFAAKYRPLSVSFVLSAVELGE